MTEPNEAQDAQFITTASNTQAATVAAWLREQDGHGEWREAADAIDAEFATGPDGIQCRDDTIKLQDARIAALREENARLRDAWEASIAYNAALGGRSDG